MNPLTLDGFEKSPILSLVYGARTRPASRIYKPLPPRSIRLLALLPATDDDAAPIVLRLRPVALEDAGPYSVVSYVWGDAAEDDEAVLLDGVALRVTASLANALRRLRHGSEARTLWIDALCMDLTDVADRGQQVGLMMAVYTRAEEVVMWSGEAGDASTGILFKRAKARHEYAKHKKLLERPLEKFPVLFCGEGSGLVRGLRDRMLGLGCRGEGLARGLDGRAVDGASSAA
ncbi:heterokaryon incompatibility domain-containing protein [Trichoderma novae-zelandiae]